MKSRIVRCGDSYFLLFGRTGLYQTKVEPVPEIWEERTWPAEVLSEADKLNNKQAAPETWQGKWRFNIGGPRRYYRENHWDPWRDDATVKYFTLTYNIEGKWVNVEGITNDGTFNPIQNYKCRGNDIDLGILSPEPTATAGVNQSAAEGTWLVIIGSYPRNELDNANQKLKEVQALGYKASVVDSNNYPKLTNGLWVVALGPYSRTRAEQQAVEVKKRGLAAYIKSGA